MIKYILSRNSKSEFGKKTLRAMRNGTMGLIALCSIGFLTSTTEVSAVDLDGCVLLPNTGNYVRYPGQIDCFTGQHVSVEANAGNNIGTPPTHADQRGTRSVYDSVCKALEQHARSSIRSAIKAKQALKNRDWHAAKAHTKNAIKHAKIAKSKAHLKRQLKSTHLNSN